MSTGSKRAQRRESYRKARMFGLTPHEAGNIRSTYGTPAFDKTIQGMLERPTRAKRYVLPSPADRERIRIAEDLRAKKTPHYYTDYNLYPFYTKVELRFKDPETGKVRRSLITIVGSKPLNRRQITQRVLADVDEGFDQYGDRDVYMGFTVRSIQNVPDRTVLGPREESELMRGAGVRGVVG